MFIFYLCCALIWPFVWGAIGHSVGAKRNRADAGFWLGFLLGPIGCVIMLLFREEEEPYANYPRIHRHMPSMLVCPYCGAKCQGRGVVQCQKCGEEFDSGR